MFIFVYTMTHNTELNTKTEDYKWPYILDYLL